MVIVPEKLIFLETPRTGSRATAVAFEENVQRCKRSGCRHVLVKDVPRETGLPVWTFTRHPVNHIFSWYNYGLQMKAPWVFVKDGSRIMRFGEFITAPFKPLAGFGAGRLNFYHEVVTHYWPLEWGIKHFFAYLGYQDVNVRNIGAIRPEQEIKPIEERLISSAFHEDFELYRSVTVPKGLQSRTKPV
jgi:hypothetical protein